MIRFKYKPNLGMMQLIMETVPEAPVDGFIYGMLEEESRLQLRNLSIYLVCSVEDNKGLRVYRDPTAVVAKNDYDAVRIFADDTGKAGSVMCMLEEFANKVKVYSI